MQLIIYPSAIEILTHALLQINKRHIQRKCSMIEIKGDNLKLINHRLRQIEFEARSMRLLRIAS